MEENGRKITVLVKIKHKQHLKYKKLLNLIYNKRKKIKTTLRIPNSPIRLISFQMYQHTMLVRARSK